MPTELTTAHHEWDKRWAEESGREGWLQAEPAVRRWYQQYLLNQGRKEATQVIDLGCGVGRHALWYAEQGAEVLAIDGSEQGLQFGQDSAAKAGVAERIRWQLGSFQQIPSADAQWDVVLAWNVIYHGTIDDLAISISEIHRVLKPGGYMQLTLLSKRNGNFGVGREVAPDTWINDQNPEKAHAHCYCSAADVIRLLGERFEICELIDCEHKHPTSKSWHWELVAEAR